MSPTALTLTAVGVGLNTAILFFVGSTALAAFWRYYEQCQTIIRVARNRARHDEIQMFQNGLINDPGFQQLTFQWQKALNWPCCCTCRPGANKASRRLRVALRRIVENKGNMPPWDSELLEGDDPPIRCHTPPVLRGETEQRYLLTHDPFCDSPAIIDLANWIMDQEEDKVWAQFLEILKKPVNLNEDCEGSVAEEIEEHELVSRSTPDRRPGFEPTRGGGDRAGPHLPSHSDSSGVVLAADEAKRIAVLRIASMPRTATGSVMDSGGSSISSDRSNSHSVRQTSLMRMKSNLGTGFRQAGEGQIGAMTNQVEANRAVRDSADTSFGDLPRVPEYEDNGETSSLLGSVRAPSSIGRSATPSARRLRGSGGAMWDAQSMSTTATSRQGPRRTTGPLYSPPDALKLKELQEQNLGKLRRPPLGLMTQEADELMTYAKISLEEDPDNAVQLMIKAQQRLYSSGVVQPTMVTLAEECLRQAGEPRIRPDMNNIEYLMAIRYEIDSRKWAKAPLVEKRRLTDRVCNCLSNKVCCCGSPADDIDRDKVPDIRPSPREQIAMAEAEMKNNPQVGDRGQPRPPPGGYSHGPSPQASLQGQSRYQGDLRALQADSRAPPRGSPVGGRGPEKLRPASHGPQAALSAQAGTRGGVAAGGSSGSPLADPPPGHRGGQFQARNLPPASQIALHARSAGSGSAQGSSTANSSAPRSSTSRPMSAAIRNSFPFNQMALSSVPEQAQAAPKPISRRVQGPTGVVRGVEHAAAWLGGIDPEAGASSDSGPVYLRTENPRQESPRAGSVIPRASQSLTAGQYQSRGEQGLELSNRQLGPPKQAQGITARGDPERPEGGPVTAADFQDSLARAMARINLSPEGSRTRLPGALSGSREIATPSVSGDDVPSLDVVELGEANVSRAMDRKPSAPHPSRLNRISSAEPLNLMGQPEATGAPAPQSLMPPVSQPAGLRPSAAGQARGNVRSRASALDPGSRGRVPSPSNDTGAGSPSAYGHPIMPHDPSARSQSSNGA